MRCAGPGLAGLVLGCHSQLGGAEQPPPPPPTQTTTATTAMSEEHFDQWEHYNFEEKVVRSRNSGEEPVLVVPILLSLSQRIS